jgi:serine/threonine protein kinase
MEGHPILLSPEGTLGIVALGGAGCIYQDSSCRDKVIKAPLKYNVEGCSLKVHKSVEIREEFSELCINREKLVYQALPKDEPNILNCLAITDIGIHFPYLRHGDVRKYLQEHSQSLDTQTRDRWIKSAIDAIATIHEYGVIHSDISARNFLVADDLSIQLCDFAGSSINGLESLVEEETRYLSSPSSSSVSSPRTIQTDLFALGSFIYEVSTGARPFADIDDEEVERLYAAKTFPSLNGLEYQDIISKCWNSQYTSADMLRRDIQRRNHSAFDPARLSHPFLFSTLAIFSLGYVVWMCRGRNFRVRSIQYALSSQYFCGAYLPFIGWRVIITPFTDRSRQVFIDIV